jgi:hypothetical protein
MAFWQITDSTFKSDIFQCEKVLAVIDTAKFLDTIIVLREMFCRAGSSGSRLIFVPFIPNDDQFPIIFFPQIVIPVIILAM